MNKQYSMDMSHENKKKQLLNEGWHKFEIIACEEQVSKSGNEMFKFTFLQPDIMQEEEVYAIATSGKRWFLKSILEVCDIEAAQDGVYNWRISDILGKTVSGRIEHIDEEWINRKGEVVKSKKHKIVEIQIYPEDSQL